MLTSISSICFYFSSVLAYLWPVIGRATVVAKKELLYAFPFGLASYLWGTLFIDRANKSDAMNKLNQESTAIQKNAAKLLMFPEGTRHLGNTLLPFKKGILYICTQNLINVLVAMDFEFPLFYDFTNFFSLKGAFHIAIQSESAIQPVVVSKYYFLDSKRKTFGRGKKKK